MKADVRCDWALLWTTLLLVLVGMLTVYTASVHIAEQSFGGSHVFLKRNAVRALVGFVAMAFAYLIDYRSYRRHAKKAILLAIVLLVATLLFGRTVRGMRGFLLMFQPSEVAKLVLVVYLADVLARRREELGNFLRGLLPRLTLVGIVVALILLQPDFGSAVAVVVLSLVLLFLGGARLSHIGALGVAAVPGVWLAIKIVPHITERWEVWRATFGLSLGGLDTRGAAYQIFQSLVALGSGGLWGRGVGASMQRAFIPDPYTDFAFSVWGEEVGLLGTLGLVCAFAFLLMRGLRIAKNAPDDYGQILASGLTAMITIYAAINIAVATALVPTTGLPLPFVSYGGSSLVVNMIAIGILLNMSRRPGRAGAARLVPAEMADRWSARRRSARAGASGRRTAGVGSSSRAGASGRTGTSGVARGGASGRARTRATKRTGTGAPAGKDSSKSRVAKRPGRKRS